MKMPLNVKMHQLTASSVGTSLKNLLQQLSQSTNAREAIHNYNTICMVAILVWVLLRAISDQILQNRQYCHA